MVSTHGHCLNDLLFRWKSGQLAVDIPAIVLSGGPMLNGYYNNGLAGSGTVVWFARQELAAGRIDYDQFLKMVASAAPSPSSPRR